MRVLPALLFAPIFLATGCGGCGVPFTHEIEGQLRLEFGEIGENCDASGTDTTENGTVTYEHTAVAVAGGPSLCGLHADWAGPLLNMEETKEGVEAEMVKQGLEPGTVTITFTGVDFEITDVAIRDSAGTDLTPPTIPSYTGALSIEGEEDLIVVEHAEGGDVENPDITVKESQVLVDTVNTAYAAGDTIPGTGTTTAVIDLETAATLGASDHPALVIDFVVKVEASIGF